MDSTTPYIGKLDLKISHQRFDVTALIKAAILDLMRIKVTVGALALTPGEMDIQRERRERSERDCSLKQGVDKKPNRSAIAALTEPALGLEG